MKAIFFLLIPLAPTQGLEALTFSVGCNGDFIIMAGESFFGGGGNLISFNISLHAGVSATEHRSRQVISHSAFVDAVNDYQMDDDETDTEGEIHASD
jgi:hypothetical protein